MPDVWLLPYLPLTNECQVGPYGLVPFRDLSRRHATSQVVYNEVRRLRTAYRVSSMGQPFGAIVVPEDSRIGGEELEREQFPALHGAVLAATIDANPILIGADDMGNSGHATATAENAKMFGHPLTGEYSYAIQTGAMVTVLSWRSSEPGRPLPKIHPPANLPEPMFFSFDAEYASALHHALCQDSDDARRLALAIDWLNITWSNNEDVSARTRALAHRSAFEALLGGEASTKKQREALSSLLDDRKRSDGFDAGPSTTERNARLSSPTSNGGFRASACFATVFRTAMLSAPRGTNGSSRTVNIICATPMLSFAGRSSRRSFAEVPILSSNSQHVSEQWSARPRSYFAKTARGTDRRKSNGTASSRFGHFCAEVPKSPHIDAYPRVLLLAPSAAPLRKPLQEGIFTARRSRRRA